MTTTQMTAGTGFDPAKAEAFGGRLAGILGGGLLSLMVDIGHRVGLFAAAAEGWNTRNAGLADRITLRRVDVVSLEDRASYDCIWFPTFFVTEAVLDAAVPRLLRSLRPGGSLVLGRMAPPPDPLAEAVTALRTIRSGGADYDPKRLTSALEAAGCADVRTVPRSGPAPLEYIIGRRE